MNNYQSVVDVNVHYDENDWVVSLVVFPEKGFSSQNSDFGPDGCRGYALFGHAALVIEGHPRGIEFVGQYDIHPKAFHQFACRNTIGNTQGYLAAIQCRPSREARLAYPDMIFEASRFPHEEGQSPFTKLGIRHKSVIVTAEQALSLRDNIENDALKLKTHWSARFPKVLLQRGENAFSDLTTFSSDILTVQEADVPQGEDIGRKFFFERFGGKSIFSHGGNNCVTYCVGEIHRAGIGNWQDEWIPWLTGYFAEIPKKYTNEAWYSNLSCAIT